MTGAERIVDLVGLGRSQPLIAGTLCTGLLALGGIPPLAGFLNKLYILIPGLALGHYTWCFIAMIFSVVSTFYYLRVIRWIYFQDATYTTAGNTISLNIGHLWILAISTYLTLTLCIFPVPFLSALQI